VDLEDALGIEGGALEMPIDVGGVNAGPVLRAFGPAAQDREAQVGRGGPVEVEAMAVKAPGSVGSPRNQSGLASSAKLRPSLAKGG
jgi:hypothetical protein